MLSTVEVVVLYIIETIHTCNLFDITIIIVMSDLHIRIMCRCTTWNVVIWQLGLVEARVTHVRAKQWTMNTPEARLAHAEIYFLVNLWQGVAVGLNVKCSKLDDDDDVKKMHTEFIHNEFTHNVTPAWTQRANALRMDSELVSGSRGVVGLNEVLSLCYKLM